MRFREKISVFIFGLTVGLLAGCLFFIFKLDSYVRKFDVNLLSQKTNVIEQIVSNESTQNKKTSSENKSTEKTTIKKETKNQSLFSFNDVNDSSYASSEKYEVLKEELISVKNLYVKTVTPIEKTSSTDSLAAALAEVSTPAANDFFMIEFWKTPLNSKGYKMTRSRLIIYGYTEKPDLALIKRNDDYFLRNNNIIYKLNYSAE